MRLFLFDSVSRYFFRSAIQTATIRASAANANMRAFIYPYAVYPNDKCIISHSINTNMISWRLRSVSFLFACRIHPHSIRYSMANQPKCEYRIQFYFVTLKQKYQLPTLLYTDTQTLDMIMVIVITNFMHIWNGVIETNSFSLFSLAYDVRWYRTKN